MPLQPKAAVVMPLLLNVGVDWNELVETEEDTAGVHGDNTLPTTGGRGGNSKRARSQSSNRTEERVSAKRGGGVRGVKDLWIDQDPLDRLQLKIPQTPGTVRISLRSGRVP